MPEIEPLEAPEPLGRHPISHWEEMVVAILLSLAALTSSWCGYQSARWSGVQTMWYDQAGAARTQSIGAGGTADQKAAIDVQLFSNWLNAAGTEQMALADFYRERFREEFRPAFEAWLALQPLKDPEAPETPFLMPEYTLADRARALDLAAEADRRFNEASAANQQSDDYVLTTVILSSVLFLAGIVSNFDRKKVRWGMMAVAGFLLVFALFNVIRYPVA